MLRSMKSVVIEIVICCLFCVSFCQAEISKNASIVIVGAGPSGIAAATKLLENNFTNIKILEAEDRIGGRIHSVEFGNGIVDLGAQYCHGQRGNIVYELVKGFGVFKYTSPTVLKDMNIFSSNGKELPEDLANDLKATIECDCYFSKEANVTQSYADVFLKDYNSKILNKYKQDQNKFKLAQDATKLFNNMASVLDAASDWSEVSAASYYEDAEGDLTITWGKHGYRLLLDVLIKSYPNSSNKLPIDDKIFLSSTVKTIIWNDDSVVIETANSSLLKADHVILTPSIGVLQHQKDSLFQPKLPSKKLAAIEAVGFGGVMKVLLHFPHKWWNDDDPDVLFVWRNEDLQCIRDEFAEGPTRNNISWVSSTVGVLQYRDIDNVKIIWLTGHLLPEIEKLPEEVLLKGCMYAIHKFLGTKYNITNPDKMLRSQWNINPNFRGTYSFDKVGYFRKEFSYRSHLAEPLINKEGKPTVLFAGEATSSTHYSTVHGAVETGYREAERLINLYN